MKINPIFSLIVLMISGLLGYLVYCQVEDTDYAWVFCICSIICFSVTLVTAMAMHYTTRALAMSGRALAFVVFLLFILTQFIPAYANMNVRYYVVLNMIILLSFLAILYSLILTKQH